MYTRCLQDAERAFDSWARLYSGVVRTGVACMYVFMTAPVGDKYRCAWVCERYPPPLPLHVP